MIELYGREFQEEYWKLFIKWCNFRTNYCEFQEEYWKDIFWNFFYKPERHRISRRILKGKSVKRSTLLGTLIHNEFQEEYWKLQVYIVDTTNIQIVEFQEEYWKYLCLVTIRFLLLCYPLGISRRILKVEPSPENIQLAIYWIEFQEEYWKRTSMTSIYWCQQ